MTFGSLFSGIGGIDLGLERAGMTCRWQVEIDPFCRKILAKHWPDVRRYEDVRAVGADNLEFVDVIAGGFPCQDVSFAGKRAGIKEGTRSGLWFEFHRIICELRPRYVLVENVPGLLANGMGRVLGDMAEIGYDAEWQVLSAADMGAPHRRERVWVLGYPHGEHTELGQSGRIGKRGEEAASARPVEHRDAGCGRGIAREQVLAYPERIGPQGQGEYERPFCFEKDSSGETVGTEYYSKAVQGHWQPEPNVGRVADGVPDRVDRLKGLGNAVVPQCAEYIGKMLLGWGKI